MSDKPVNVALFVTCLVDLFRPSIGFAAVKLLKDAGCVVHVPPSQTCCGQPGYNSGARNHAKLIATQVIDVLAGYDAVVVPSGSCAGMIREHYPALFADDPGMAPRARDLAERVHELISFLTDVLGVEKVEASFDGVVTYHDACSGLRELGIKEQPRKLLRTVRGLELTELPDAEVCCGFGGTFCVKYSDISLEMVRRKGESVAATLADTLLAGDLGCLMNMAGRLMREGSAIRVRHVAEVLAGMTDQPAIGEAREPPAGGGGRPAP